MRNPARVAQCIMECLEYFVYGILGIFRRIFVWLNMRARVFGGLINEKCSGIYKLWPER